MLGMFRLTVAEKTRVSEFVMITKEEERVIFRFKHFNPDFTTWEKEGPLEFTLIRVSEREAVFHSELPSQDSPRRITYRLNEEDELLALVHGSDDSGELRESFELRFRRD